MTTLLSGYIEIRKKLYHTEQKSFNDSIKDSGSIQVHGYPVILCQTEYFLHIFQRNNYSTGQIEGVFQTNKSRLRKVNIFTPDSFFYVTGGHYSLIAFNCSCLQSPPGKPVPPASNTKIWELSSKITSCPVPYGKASPAGFPWFPMVQILRLLFLFFALPNLQVYL